MIKCQSFGNEEINNKEYEEFVNLCGKCQALYDGICLQEDELNIKTKPDFKNNKCEHFVK